MMTGKKSLFFSIIIPVSKTANRALLKKCLNHLSKQDYKRYEVILVEEAKTNLSKSQARNYGVKKAKGKYLVHIDIDYKLPPSILFKCRNLISKKRARAIILRENVDSPENIWQKARRLEKEILGNNKYFSTPQVVEAKLFKKIGGFDEQVDALDDWVLNIKLKKAGIRSYEINSPETSVYEPTNITEIVKRRFNKGRYLKPFKEKYGDVSQTTILPTVILYWKHLTKSPTSLSTLTTLVILKFFDLSAFYLGSLFPNSTKYSQPSNLYNSPSVAKLFDSEQKTLYARFKHYIEVKAILNLLPPITNHQSPITILELGCGTGRITQILVDSGFKVTPTDVSPAMLNEYKKKIKSLNLPKPTFLKHGKLPYKDKSFDHVIAIRVVWHIPDKKRREVFLKEAVRVAKKSVIIDFAIKSTGLNFMFGADHLFSIKEVTTFARSNNLIISSELWLPLGRKLIKFTKS